MFTFTPQHKETSMAEIIKYASDVDGTVFDTETEQLAYDAAKKHQAAIDAFLDRHYPKPDDNSKKSGPARAIVAKGLALWLSEQKAA